MQQTYDPSFLLPFPKGKTQPPVSSDFGEQYLGNFQLQVKPNLTLGSSTVTSQNTAAYNVSDPSSTFEPVQMPSDTGAVPLIPTTTGGPPIVNVKESEVISISTSFCPGAHTKPDTVFCSVDGVFFYVNTQNIALAAPGAFASFLNQGNSTSSFIKIPESSSTLNVLFHALYGTSCAHHSPLLDDLVRAVDCMPGYGIIPGTLVHPHTPLYALLLSFAPLQPMVVYSLAGQHELVELAEQVSSHLLSYPLATVDDALATRIGPIFLRRLFMLHWKRLSYLKDCVLQPPPHHTPHAECTVEDQNKLTRAWSLAAAYLVWDARPDLSTHMINSAFESLMKNVTCKDCEASSNARIRQVLTKWAAMKCTI